MNRSTSAQEAGDVLDLIDAAIAKVAKAAEKVLARYTTTETPGDTDTPSPR